MELSMLQEVIKRHVTSLKHRLMETEKIYLAFRLRGCSADFGLACAPLDALVVDGPQQSAEMIRRVLRGEPGTARDIVLANAAAALWTAGRAESPQAGVQLAAEAIDGGAATRLLARLIEQTRIA